MTSFTKGWGIATITEITLSRGEIAIAVIPIPEIIFASLDFEIGIAVKAKIPKD